MLDSANSRVWPIFINLLTSTKRDKNIWKLHIAFVNSGNQAWAASIASEFALLYSMASQLRDWVLKVHKVFKKAKIVAHSKQYQD